MATGISFNNIKRIIKPKYIVKGFSVENLKRGFTYISSPAKISDMDYGLVFHIITSYEANAGFGAWDRYVSFSRILNASEIIVGTPEVTTDVSGVLISGISVNTSAIVDGSHTIQIGHAIHFRVSTTITQEIDVIIDISCITNEDNIKTVSVGQPIKVIEK